MPRHPPCALINLTTIIDISILIWWDFNYYTLNKYSNRCIERLVIFNTTTISSFQRTISERIISQNQAKLISNSVRFFLRILLLRKEVIHPHVPVGIPCYDFTPVTGPTLIGPLPCGLGYHLRVLPTPMAWRAVCTTPGNVFTPTFWFGITSDSNFMESSCRLQSGLGLALEICSTSRYCILLYQPL